MPNSPFFQKTTDVLPSLKPYYQWEGFHGQEFVSSTNNVFADLKGKGTISPVQQREMDARYVVFQLKKRYMSQLKDSLRGKKIDPTFGETSI